MGKRGLSPDDAEAVEKILGHLNFSSGAPDPRLLTNLNQLWKSAVIAESSEPPWQAVGNLLLAELERLSGKSAALQDAAQAAAILDLVWNQTLPGYFENHRDLLFHQTEERLYNAFFVGRVCEAVLAQREPWSETDRIQAGAIGQLNDYLGYRPVAVLESRKIEPYPHERLRPIPLLVRNAGVAAGPYEEVVTRAMELLEQTDEDILRTAFFDPQVLEELAIDARAYDFDHPVNKRPNYHFGQWDPHHIDNQGRYTRFVIQQVTLDALMQRLDSDAAPLCELMVEAAAVLAGIILMGAGISGAGPDTHDSTTTLSTLLPQIAGYRDAFYERLLSRVPGEHGKRLVAEAAERRQPFGSARQHLNAQLARRRAAQLEHVQLAKIFARMGYPEAAKQESNIVPTPSARMLCRIDCRITATQAAISRQDPERAVTLLSEAVEILHRGIECGALVDPWNILGFDAQFSLFPATENSVHDHRIDELIVLMEEIFGLYSRALAETAGGDNLELAARIANDFRSLANWWRQFAAHEVSHVEAIDAFDAYNAAEHVARALKLWHAGGAAAGDIGFWAPHAQMFDSAQAYALVTEALLDQSDHVAALGLLVHWLSESDRVPLEQGDSSLYRLAERWLLDVRRADLPSAAEPLADDVPGVSGPTWRLIRKFFDYVEANAESYWETPTFELASNGRSEAAQDPELADPFANDEGDDDEDLFGAAYENVVFHDSANDGIQGEIFDTSDATEDELVRESQRVTDRLSFMSTLARLWKNAGLTCLHESCDREMSADRLTAMRHWIEKLQHNRTELMELVGQVRGYRIPTPQGDHDSMLAYDRRRMYKEGLLDRIIATSTETADAVRLLRSVIVAEACEPDSADMSDVPREERLTIQAVAAILRRDHARAKSLATELIDELADLPLLYVPLAKGGDAREIVAARIRQRSIQDLLLCLPRIGLYVETFRLIETAREMERNHPVGAGAVTEFDEMFKIGYKSLVQSLVVSAEQWEEEEESEHHSPNLTDSPLVACLEQLTEAALHSWLEHSKTLRLSVLEKVSDKRSWNKLVEFIETYGDELFTQRFLNLGNVRAILHQGADTWFTQVQDERGGTFECRLLDEIDDKITRQDAVYRLTLVLEAIIENYSEYRDYNSTTTQSDRGDLLYTLLDFLRLQTKYDRVCWNLKPVVLAHEILVRRGCKRAAQLWRRALRERIDSEADKFVARLEKLRKQYAMQMPSIADRINERFMRLLVIDRLCSLVQPAVAEAQHEGPRPTFRMLQYETEFLTREPSGVGFDLPPWLAALDEEVQRVAQPPHERDDYDELELAVPLQRLTYEEAIERLDEWTDE
ncbi:MAG: hypothetical protein O3C40_23475 [Planctomycetota bacterium]|nr:hypothetical protein [Planctomycetota bacterium]